MEELNILHTMEKPLVIFLPGTAADPRRWDASARFSLDNCKHSLTVTLLHALALSTCCCNLLYLPGPT